jgi:hypothetical protein
VRLPEKDHRSKEIELVLKNQELSRGLKQELRRGLREEIRLEEKALLKEAIVLLQEREAVLREAHHLIHHPAGLPLGAEIEAAVPVAAAEEEGNNYEN